MRKIIPVALTIAALTAPLLSAQARPHAARHRAHQNHYVRSYDREPSYGRSAYEGRRSYGGGYGYETNPYNVPAHSRTGRVPVGTYGEPVPFRTVQPTDVGIGALAPNGYRGPGTASGGPAGGIDNGGGR